MDFLAISSLYHSQGGATPATPHAPMADVYYGPDGPSPNDMQFSKSPFCWISLHIFDVFRYGLDFWNPCSTNRFSL